MKLTEDARLNYSRTTVLRVTVHYEGNELIFVAPTNLCIRTRSSREVLVEFVADYGKQFVFPLDEYTVTLEMCDTIHKPKGASDGTRKKHTDK